MVESLPSKPKTLSVNSGMAKKRKEKEICVLISTQSSR
jgi:hypothetical protein